MDWTPHLVLYAWVNHLVQCPRRDSSPDKASVVFCYSIRNHQGQRKVPIRTSSTYTRHASGTLQERASALGYITNLLTRAAVGVM